MKRTTIVSPGQVLSIIERDCIEILEHTVIALLSKFYIKTCLGQREPPKRVKENKEKRKRERKGREQISLFLYLFLSYMKSLFSINKILLLARK
jgi:hypothetical protein